LNQSLERRKKWDCANCTTFDRKFSTANYKINKGDSVNCITFVREFSTATKLKFRRESLVIKCQKKDKLIRQLLEKAKRGKKTCQIPVR
jgi:hypothetical protein